MFGRMREDVRVFKERDPATDSTLEIILCYPGLHAIWFHRLSGRLYRANRRTTARLVNRFSHMLTGIDMHPGAKIGRGFFIDHGTGIVIGETTEIGKNVSLYQGVTLGGTGKDKGKRHPTIGDDVTISAGASVLGPITIGRGSKIGAGAVVIKDVPECCTVVGVPGRIVRRNGERVSPADLNHASLPDPVQEALENIIQRLERLEAKSA